MESTTLQAQQAAIQEVRTRFERGELSFEEFRRVLDALVLVRDADECDAILRELPSTSTATSLAALERPTAVAPASGPAPLRKRIVAFMAETKKLRRPWKLQQDTDVVAFMGDVKLDLGLAELPAQGSIHVRAIMGDVTLYVPSNVRVSVRSRVFLGEAKALGEGTEGVVAFGHEEHIPADGQPRATLDIEVLSVMASVKVVLQDGPVVSIKELVRDALQAAVVGMQRGLQAGYHPPALGASGDVQRVPGLRKPPRD